MFIEMFIANKHHEFQQSCNKCFRLKLDNMTHLQVKKVKYEGGKLAATYKKNGIKKFD